MSLLIFDIVYILLAFGVKTVLFDFTTILYCWYAEVTLILNPSGPAFLEMILKDKAVKFPDFLNYALKYMSIIW